MKRIRPDKAGDPRARARFLREARLAARLHHPSLVSVHDILEEDETLWIVMELVNGETLDEWLKPGPPALQIGLQLALDIASGLDAIHEGGILHRDLTTKNVMVAAEKTSSGERALRARLLDFGLAKARDEATATLTKTDELVGTPRSMSPEQARGESVDVRSDLFSLGILLYELFVGISPFAAESALETLARVCHHEPDPMGLGRPEIPEALDRWVGRLLTKDPNRRPDSAREGIAVLEGLVRTAAQAGREAVGAEMTVETRPPLLASPRSSSSGRGQGFEFRAERRQLTVVCAELVSLGRSPDASSGSLEPESLIEVLPLFRDRLNRVLERYGGHLGALAGHRTELYFGWPHALEDGISRAAAAALELADAGRELADPRPEKIGLAVRVGVHSGPVTVVATEGGGERLVLSETWDRAIELRASALPGEVRISPSLRWQVEEDFEIEDPDSESPGSARLLRARKSWHGGSSAGDSDSAGPSTPLAPTAPMVARRPELDLLRQGLRQAATGRGGAMSILAEPGMGKTRLLRAFRENPGMGASFEICRASSFRPRNTLAPISELFSRLLGLQPPEVPEEGIGTVDWDTQLTRALDAYDLPTEDLLPTLGPWLGAAGKEAGLGAGAPDPDREAVRLAPELLLELVQQRLETEGPTVLIFEDLQWVDPETLRFLETLIEGISACPLLLVVTARPGFEPPWGRKRQLTDLPLRPLTAEESATLLAGFVEAMGLELGADGQHRRWIERAKGRPRYLEELAKAARNSELVFPGSGVPISLFDGLMEMLDRVGTARDLARFVAVVPGDGADLQLLRELTLDPVGLEHEVGRLLDSGVWVRPREEPTMRDYGFSHPLLKEVALASVTEPDRRRIEQRIRHGNESAEGTGAGS